MHDTPEAVELRFQGNVDLQNVEAVRVKLAEAAEKKAAAYVLDFGGVDFVDSAGLGALVTFHKNCKSAKIRVLRVNDRVRRLFQITRLDSIFALDG